MPSLSDSSNPPPPNQDILRLVWSLRAGRDTEPVQVQQARARRPEAELLNVGSDRSGLTIFQARVCPVAFRPCDLSCGSTGRWTLCVQRASLLSWKHIRPIPGASLSVHRCQDSQRRARVSPRLPACPPSSPADTCGLCSCRAGIQAQMGSPHSTPCPASLRASGTVC